MKEEITKGLEEALNKAAEAKKKADPRFRNLPRFLSPEQRREAAIKAQIDNFKPTPGVEYRTTAQGIKRPIKPKPRRAKE